MCEFLQVRSVQMSRRQDITPKPKIRCQTSPLFLNPANLPPTTVHFSLNSMRDACVSMDVQSPVWVKWYFWMIRQYSLASSSSFMNTSSWGFSGHFSPLLGGRTAWKRLQSPLHRIQGSTSTLKWSSGENSVLMRLGVPAPFPRVISCPRSL